MKKTLSRLLVLGTCTLTAGFAGGCIVGEDDRPDLVVERQLASPKVTVEKSQPYGVFNGRAYTYVEATMTGAVARGAGQPNGSYSVGLVLIHPTNDDGNGVGLVDWPNSVFYSFYDFQPIEQLTLQMTTISTGNYAFDNGYTYASVQWNKAVTDLFGPTQPSGEGHNRLVYGTIEQSADAWQILTDVARWVRKPQFTSGTAPRAVDKVIASGFSQTAALQLEFLSTNRNVDPATNSKSIYDGFMAQMTGLICYQRTDEAPVFGNFAPCATFPNAGKAKVMVIASESDFPLLNAYGSRGDGSDPNYIQYELAGVSHIPKTVIDIAGFGATRQNHADSKRFVRGAFDNLTKWATTDSRPPSSPAIEGTFDGANFEIARDADGNALGGIRLPHLTHGNAGAPSGTYTGVEPAGLDPFNLFLTFSGTYEKFSDSSLVARYPNCASYTSKVAASANALFSGGYISAADRDSYINGTPELSGTSAWSFTCGDNGCTCQDH